MEYDSFYNSCVNILLSMVLERYTAMAIATAREGM